MAMYDRNKLMYDRNKLIQAKADLFRWIDQDDIEKLMLAVDDSIIRTASDDDDVLTSLADKALLRNGDSLLTVALQQKRVNIAMHLIERKDSELLTKPCRAGSVLNLIISNKLHTLFELLLETLKSLCQDNPEHDFQKLLKIYVKQKE